MITHGSSHTLCGVSFLKKYLNSKTRLKRPLRKNGFQDRLSLNAGQKYYRMLQEEPSAKRTTFIKLPSVCKYFVLSIYE